jgi:hypothetical protein
LGGREPIVKPTSTEVGFLFLEIKQKEVVGSEDEASPRMPKRRRYGVLNSDEDKTALMKNQSMQFTQQRENIKHNRKGERA